ncbi:hypothetical protein GGI07_002434 [Coemansia sp. Benny D115]|nr:hypothetical protein GGI07_002434 [Coemansia sp. Benny D115]
MDVQRLVDAYIIGLGDNSDNTELRQTLVSRISSGDTSLLELVQALGEYLASEEASRRSKGVQVLADLLTDLPATAIPMQALSRLVQFFNARLTDATCVPHVLTAINALLRLDAFGDSLCVQVLQTLFKEVHVQSFQYSTRASAYHLLELALNKWPQAVKKMGDGFVLGFAQMLDGEKDPRALAVAFALIPRMADLVDIKNNAEDLFDVIFCYFPITFKRREDDPSAISPEALKAALKQAITCSPHLGPLAVKPLVEKTAAAAARAKIDALEALAAGTRVFAPEVYRKELEVLVEQIREDVVMAADDNVVNAALETLEAVYVVIQPASPGAMEVASPSDTDEASSPLDYVLKEAMFQLTAEQIKNPEQIGRLLRAVARSSAYNCSVVSDAILPIIVERLDSADVLTVRRELMDVLNYVLSASCDVEKRAECLDSDKTNLLNIYRPDTAIPLNKEYSFLHIVRLKGITLLILLPEFLDENETEVALRTLAQAAIERNEEENVNKEATHLLVQLSQSRPEQIQKVVLPMFFKALSEPVVAMQRVARLLNALGALGVSASKILIPALQGLVDIAVSGSLAPVHCLAAASTVRKMVEAVIAKDSKEIGLCAELFAKVVVPLAGWVKQVAQLPEHGGHALELLVLEIARATTAVFSRLDSEAQAQHLGAIFAEYQAIALLVPGPGVNSNENPLALCQLLPLFSAIVCACRPQTLLPVDNLPVFLGDLAAVSLASENTVQQKSAFEIISSVINKTASIKERSDLTQAVFQKVPASKDGSSTVESATPNCIRLHQWVARALVNCNDKRGYESVSWLLDQISSNASAQASVEAAQGLDIILGDHDWCITAATHGVLKVLAKQRFYSTVVPQIKIRFNEAADDLVKTNLLVALTSVVRHMPKSVLMNGVESIVPLLLSAIRLTQGPLKAASIRTITMVMLESPETLQEDLATDIVPLLATALTLSSANTVEVRRSACDALALVPEKYIYTVVHTARKEVLKTLVKARDDQKRLVRQDATKAYNKWLSFGDS